MQVAPATAQRILKRNGRVVKPTVAKTTKRFEKAECNELAQMDFKGDYTLPRESVIRSRFWMIAVVIATVSGPCPGPAAEGVKQTLEGYFREHGVPLSILMDHGTAVVQHHESARVDLGVGVVAETRSGVTLLGGGSSADARQSGTLSSNLKRRTATGAYPPRWVNGYAGRWSFGTNTTMNDRMKHWGRRPQVRSTKR